MTTASIFVQKCKHCLETIHEHIKPKLRNERYKNIFHIRQFDKTLLNELGEFAIDYEDAIISGKEPPISFFSKLFILLDSVRKDIRRTRASSGSIASLRSLESSFDDYLELMQFTYILRPEQYIDNYTNLTENDKNLRLAQYCERDICRMDSSTVLEVLHDLHHRITDIYVKLNDFERDWQTCELFGLNDEQFEIAIKKYNRICNILDVAVRTSQSNANSIVDNAMFESLVKAYHYIIFVDVKNIIDKY